MKDEQFQDGFDVEVEVDGDGLFTSAIKVPKTDKPINPDFPTGGERFGGQFKFKHAPMKKLSIAGILSLLAIASLGAVFNLTWQPSPTPGVTYRVYSSTNSGATWKLEVQTTNLMVTTSNAPIPITYSVSAFNTNGESGKAIGETLYRPTGVRIVEQ
jgi:hypothetical protein